jgi:hypothetical protein
VSIRGGSVSSLIRKKHRRHASQQVATMCRTESLFNSIAGVVFDWFAEPVEMFGRGN